MNNIERALVESWISFGILEPHRSSWIREVARKSKERIIYLVGINYIKGLEKEYTDNYHLENKT